MTIEQLIERIKEEIPDATFRWGDAGHSYFIGLEAGGKIYRYWIKKQPATDRDAALLISNMNRDIRLGWGERIMTVEIGGEEEEENEPDDIMEDD